MRALKASMAYIEVFTAISKSVYGRF